MFAISDFVYYSLFLCFFNKPSDHGLGPLVPMSWFDYDISFLFHIVYFIASHILDERPAMLLISTPASRGSPRSTRPGLGSADS